MTTWRQKATPVIAEVIQRVGRDDMKVLKKAIREAYPFGERAYYPYKAWLSEVKRQLYGRPPRMIDNSKLTVDPNQQNLF